MGLLNTVTSVNKKYMSSQRSSTELILAETGEGKLSKAGLILVLREERLDRQKIRDDVNDAKLKELVADLDSTNQCLILYAKKQVPG